MEQRTSPCRNDIQMEFHVRNSSRDRFWAGFVAIVYDTSGGYDETYFVSNAISMHIGAPVAVTSRCDGATLRKIQSPGDLKVVPAGYSRVWETERPTSKLVVNISPALMRSTAEEIGIGAERASIAPQLHLRDPRIEHIAWALKAELESETPSGRLYAESLGVALTAHLLQNHRANVSRALEKGLPKRSLRRVMDYIAEHMSQDLSLAELAQIANVSPSHFKAMFKQSVGLPPHQYVVRCRVEYATALLVEGRIPLSQIALQAGFAHQSHMARCMRRISGLAPRAARNTIA